MHGVQVQLVEAARGAGGVPVLLFRRGFVNAQATLPKGQRHTGLSPTEQSVLGVAAEGRTPEVDVLASLHLKQVDVVAQLLGFVLQLGGEVEGSAAPQGLRSEQGIDRGPTVQAQAVEPAGALHHVIVGLRTGQAETRGPGPYRQLVGNAMVALAPVAG
ncbi:hypothetical protein D9M68_632600 [compost metagenome]